VFVQSFGSKELDAALLRLPSVDFVAYHDPRMVRTTDAIREELGDGHGLILRYRNDDGLEGREGAFVSCSFWLVECLAYQGRLQEARELFDRVSACGNDLGLFSEEYDGATGELLGNFPQGLSHLSHLAAAVALADASAPGATTPSTPHSPASSRLGRRDDDQDQRAGGCPGRHHPRLEDQGEEP
jgi:GH15 family glucan-1,4-alpha-glucosidase